MSEVSLVQAEGEEKSVAVLARKGIRLLDRVGEYVMPPVQQEPDSPEAISGRSIRVGMFALLLFFGVFGLWSAIAPLNSAAVAGGHVILDSNRKTIQHLEGGIIKEILVKEGDKVKKGEALVRLDETAAQARLDLLSGQSIAARATEARLLAERDNREDIVFPDDLLRLEQTHHAVVEENLDSQRRLFDSRRKNVEGQIAILHQKIEQFKKEIEGLKSQKNSADEQIGFLQEEIGAVRKLLASGNASKPRLLALERNKAAIDGERGDYVARISRSQQSIAEAEISMINLRNDFLNDVVGELRETQVQIADLEERIRASADTVVRINILAPISGVITGLKVHTLGGVIAPGEPIMDIVPQDDKLIVEAKVQPRDIDVVRAGLIARVRLSAYKSRKVPPVEGTVQQISADRFQDERTGEAYYLARIEISYDELDKLKKLEEVELYPGMPADVLIVTGSRTFLSYMFTPLTDSLSHAFREQ